MANRHRPAALSHAARSRPYRHPPEILAGAGSPSERWIAHRFRSTLGWANLRDFKSTENVHRLQLGD